jgi:hypothetical protein
MIVTACTAVCPAYARLAENKWVPGFYLPFERIGPKRVT